MDVRGRLEKQGGGAMMDRCSDGDSAKIETEPALLQRPAPVARPVGLKIEIDSDYVSGQPQLTASDMIKMIKEITFPYSTIKGLRLVCLLSSF